MKGECKEIEKRRKEYYEDEQLQIKESHQIVRKWKENKIEKLPPEIMEIIFTYCIETPADIIRISHTSKYFYNILNEQSELSKRIWWTISTNSYPVGIVLLKHMPPLNRFKHYKRKRTDMNEYIVFVHKALNYGKQKLISTSMKATGVQQLIRSTGMLIQQYIETIHHIKETIKTESKLFNKITYYYHTKEEQKKKVNVKGGEEEEQQKQQQIIEVKEEKKNENKSEEKQKRYMAPLQLIQHIFIWMAAFLNGQTMIKKKEEPEENQPKKKGMKRVGSYEYLYEKDKEEIQHGPYTSISSYIQTQQSLKLLKSVENSSSTSFEKVHKLHCTLTATLRYIVPLFPILEIIAFLMLVFEHFDYTYYVLSTLYHAIGVCWMLKICLCFIEIVYCKPTAYVGKYRSLHTSTWTFIAYMILSSFFFYLSSYIREGTWLEVMVVLMVGNVFVAILYMVDSPTFVKFGEFSQFIVSLLSD